MSLPRVHRLLDAVGVAPSEGRGHARRVDGEIAVRLGRQIGAVPQGVDGFSRIDLLVLAAVSRAGLGLESTRAIARVAGVSPTAAGDSLRLMEERNLVQRRQRRIVQGRPRSIEFWQADIIHSAWTPELREAVSQVILRGAKPRSELLDPHTQPVRRVPGRFNHLFWNANLASLELPKDRDFIASRMMLADDPDAWAWATSNLPPASLTTAARIRGVTPRRKALIENLVSARGS